MPAKLAIRSRADAPHLKKAALAIEQAAWSNLGYLSYTRSHYEYYAELLDAYPEYQLCLVDEETDYPVAVASSVPFVCSGPVIYRRKDGTGWSRQPLALRIRGPICSARWPFQSRPCIAPRATRA